MSGRIFRQRKRGRPDGEQGRSPPLREHPQAAVRALSDPLSRAGLRSGETTYERERDAERALSLLEAKMVTGDWTDPQRSKVKLGDYAAKWISERTELRPRTVEIYSGLLQRHVAPYFGNVALGKINTEMVREWRATLASNGVGETEIAKAYRFLRAVHMTATDDQLIPRNPCRIRGAGGRSRKSGRSSRWPRSSSSPTWCRYGCAR
ncbi:N-terminal phage integrase SAM-like domain-containing protein [Microbispora tritici]|nr:N-terminal phage integrase SAM-like domain-containing protein [Microbispora tritici]